MAIEYNCNPVIGEISIMAEEQEIRFPTVNKLVICVDLVGRVQISINDNFNYITYYDTDGKTEIFDSEGIDRLFIKSDFFINEGDEGSKVRFWGYR